MMKKISFFFMTFVLSCVLLAQNVATQKHEVQSGETFYSIAHQYNVSVASLQEANPGINIDHIMAGQKINVPVSAQKQETTAQPATTNQSVSIQQQVLDQVRQQTQAQQVAVSLPSGSPNRPPFKTLHEVQKKETIYSLSRQYGISEEELIAANPDHDLTKKKLKKGSILNIPYSAAELAQQHEAEQKAILEAQKSRIVKYPTIKVALILPFAKAEERMNAESQKMVNLYQGFLLAVDSLKQHGYNVDIYAYDEVSAATPVSTILRKPEMKEMQLIVGPMRNWNVKSVADFAHQNGITHVVPLSNELTLVNEHPTTFQLNVHNTLLYNQVFNRFSLIHKDNNIVFVFMNDQDDKSFINEFKKDLDTKGIRYSNASADDADAVLRALKKGSNNVIVPTASSASAFETLCKKLDDLNLTSEYPVQLFGYPEWQTFEAKDKLSKYLSKYKCQFFTSFYSNDAASRTQQFNSRFRRWFNQNQYQSYPKYGEMGYDIGVYFIKGIHDFGSSFYENIYNYSYLSLEFPMMFEKKNQWSGYQNRSLMIVSYRMDGSVIVR